MLLQFYFLSCQAEFHVNLHTVCNLGSEGHQDFCVTTHYYASYKPLLFCITLSTVRKPT